MENKLCVMLVIYVLIVKLCGDNFIIMCNLKSHYHMRLIFVQQEKMHKTVLILSLGMGRNQIVKQNSS